MISIDPHLPVDPAATQAVLIFFLFIAPAFGAIFCALQSWLNDR